MLRSQGEGEISMTGTGVAGERHLSIDAVRGFAVLGILLMNIVGMGLPAFAYLDPAYAGGATGADLWTWAVNNVLTALPDRTGDLQSHNLLTFPIV
jgi:predicted acyltransferase